MVIPGTYGEPRSRCICWMPAPAEHEDTPGPQHSRGGRALQKDPRPGRGRAPRRLCGPFFAGVVDHERPVLPVVRRKGEQACEITGAHTPRLDLDRPAPP